VEAELKKADEVKTAQSTASQEKSSKPSVSDTVETAGLS